MRIQVLDSQLANQIAAGEVVERPASVLKELLENSIDAGATRIKIELEGGGVERIAIVDNGHGIDKEDLELALSRYATSKISALHDLGQVATLGFRGEALASICGVARIRLVSATGYQEMGWEIQVEGRGQPKLLPCPHPIGTSVEVRDLFFNTPARRKFLRTERIELSQIEEVLRRVLLSRFNIHFQVKHQQKLLFDVTEAITKEEQEKRIAHILGREFMSKALFIEANTCDLAITGWISLPQYSRSQADMQYFYVNGRIVRNKLINHAIRLAYQDVLYHHRYPGYILFLTLPYGRVDVNVHPTKQEVRFRDSSLVRDFIASTLQGNLREITPEKVIKHSVRFESHLPLSMQKGFAIKEESASYAAKETVPSDGLSLGHALAQLHGIYILAQNNVGLILVDMHAAHERILYEKLKLQYAMLDIATQYLLIPITIEVSKQEADYVEEKQEEFKNLGFSLERLSTDTLVLRQIPALLRSQDIVQTIRDILADEMLLTGYRIPHCQHKVLAAVACKGALRANSILTIEEMNALLRELEKTQNNGVCNHGRPTWQQFTLQEIGKLFLHGR
jgi:DNA mismatch repair protein MutL